MYHFDHGREVHEAQKHRVDPWLVCLADCSLEPSGQFKPHRDQSQHLIQRGDFEVNAQSQCLIGNKKFDLNKLDEMSYKFTRFAVQQAKIRDLSIDCNTGTTWFRPNGINALTRGDWH